jgi:uncharacterized repeat protein (TIGR01451 family)
MKLNRTFGRRLAQATALMTMTAAGLIFGVPSGAAGFGLGLQNLTDVQFGAGDVVVPVDQPIADLAVAKSDSVDPVVVGTQFEYDITVTNDGPDDAAGVYLRDSLPDGLTLVSADGASCSRDGDVYCQLRDIPAKESVTVVLYVHALQPGSFKDTATVSSQTYDPNTDNNSASESTDVVSPKEDPPLQGQLTVIDHVVNDNGGNAAAGDFTIVVDGAQASPSMFQGDEQGTTVSVEPGDYKVGLEDGPAGYAGSYSDGCSGSIAAGESKTCTITENDSPAHLTVVEDVVNNNGGTATASDFALAVKGGSPDPALFNGDAEGTDVTLDAGSYAVSQETALGYHTTLSPDCEGTIAPGQAKTCTVSNVDLAPIKLALTADSARVPSGGTAGYTATLTNPNEEPVTVSYVSVVLPSGFSYQQGSTTGAITSDPSIDPGEGLSLGWEGPGEVPGNQNRALHFAVTAPQALGDYNANASGNVDAPFTIDRAGSSAVVTVVQASTPPAGNPPPSDPPNTTPSDPPNQNQTTTTSGGVQPVPPPEFQKNVDVVPVSGDVFVRLPGTNDFVPLKDGEQVGFGAELDATNGRVGLSTVDANGTVYHADFYEGRFLIGKQLANGVTVLQLSGSDFKSCKAAKRTLAAYDKKKPKKKPKKVKRSKKVVRHLWGSGTGKFRTKGRFIAATVHGTTWLTEDRCDGSRAFVQEGVVDVRDLVKHKTIQLGAGQSYVARPH